jgi:hypothetical protein
MSAKGLVHSCRRSHAAVSVRLTRAVAAGPLGWWWRVQAGCMPTGHALAHGGLGAAALPSPVLRRAGPEGPGSRAWCWARRPMSVAAGLTSLPVSQRRRRSGAFCLHGEQYTATLWRIWPNKTGSGSSIVSLLSVGEDHRGQQLPCRPDMVRQLRGHCRSPWLPAAPWLSTNTASECFEWAHPIVDRIFPSGGAMRQPNRRHPALNRHASRG